jgi:hypothetical protein
VFIKYIAKVLEGLIYLLLGGVVAGIVILLFTSLPSDDLLNKIEEITEILIFTIFVLQPIPLILKKYVTSKNNNFLSKVVDVLKHIHIPLGILFIGLRILHIEVNLLYEAIECNFETITSILLSLLLIPTVIYGFLRINNSEKYRQIHRLLLFLTYLLFIIHLFH